MPTSFNPFVENLSQLKQTDPIRMEESASYGEALALMRERKAGAVAVCRDEKVIGVFTERDVLNRCLLEKTPAKTPIKTLMTKTPSVIAASASVGEAIALMHKKKIRNLPMVDQDGRCVGLLTVGRLIRYLASQFPAVVVNLPPKPHQVTHEVEGA